MLNYRVLFELGIINIGRFFRRFERRFGESVGQFILESGGLRIVYAESFWSKVGVEYDELAYLIEDLNPLISPTNLLFGKYSVRPKR